MTGPDDNLPAVGVTAEQVDVLVAEADRRAREQVCAELAAEFADHYRAAVARELGSRSGDRHVPSARAADATVRSPAEAPTPNETSPNETSPAQQTGGPREPSGATESTGVRESSQTRESSRYGDTAWYAYAVIPHGRAAGAGAALDDLRDLVGVEGSPVELVAADGVAIAGSTVPLTGFRSTGDEPDLSAGSWLQDALRTHERVVERLCAHVTALPFRFGVLYPSRDHAHAILHLHAVQLGAELDRLDGLAEWGVRVRTNVPAEPVEKAEAAETVPMETVANRSGSEEAAPAAPTGTTWMRQRRAEAAAREESGRRRAGIGRSVHEALAPYVRDVVVRSPTRPDPSAEVVFDAVYLVPRSREGDRAFHEAVESVRTRHAGEGALDLTGPWPPYHFVRLPADLAGATGATGSDDTPATTVSVARPRGQAPESARNREGVTR